MMLAVVFVLALASPARAFASISWVTPSLVTEDHVSEGSLMCLGPDLLVDVYRLDPGVRGGHVGDGGRIGVRVSVDGAATWQLRSPIDPSPFDDRNITGCVSDGEVHLLYREYDVAKRTGIGIFGLSTRGGLDTWGSPLLLKPLVSPGLTALAPSAVTSVPGTGWLGLFYDGADWTQHSVVSTDGLAWDFSAAATLPIDPALQTSESAVAHLGSGRVLAVFRQADRGGQGFYALASADGGRSWGEPVPVPNGGRWPTAPSLVASEDGDAVFLLAGTRLNWDGDEANRGCSIRIMRSTAERLIANPADWDFYGAAPRPWPSASSLYGYPTTAELADGRHIVVFTDRGKDPDGTERANLFQFVLEDAEGNPDSPGISLKRPANVLGGASFAVSGRLADPGGAPVGGVGCILQFKNSTGSWVRAGVGTSTPEGTWTMRGVSYATSQWRVVTAATPGGHTSGFGPFTIIPGLRVSLPKFSGALEAGSPSTVTASMTPTGPRSGPVTLRGEYRVGTAWKQIASWRISSRYVGGRVTALRASITPSKRGAWRFRVVSPADATHAASASAYRYATVY